MPSFLTTRLRYHLKLNPHLALQMAPFALAEETWRQRDNPCAPLDVAILQLQRQGQVDAMVQAVLRQ